MLQYLFVLHVKKSFVSAKVILKFTFFQFEMKLKRSLSTKRCLLLWVCLVGITVLLQNGIFILVSICHKGSCCLKLGEGESYPLRTFGKFQLYAC